MLSSSINEHDYGHLIPMLETVLDAVVVINTGGLVVAWNSIAEKTFGWSASEAVGKSLADLIVPPVHRAAHTKGLAHLSAGAPARVLNKLIEITAITADGREIPVELSITQSQNAGRRLFVGFLRDISAKKRTEEALRKQASEARLMFDVARAAAEAHSFEDALLEALAAICHVSGWSVGHAFLVSAGEPARLVSTQIWYEDEPGAADHLRKVTDQIDFGAGVGLPGKILTRGEPLWLSDVEQEINFPRAGLGFRGAFGFPVKYQGRAIAVLEFFTHSPTPPDSDRLLTVATLGEQMGRIFERRQKDDRERVLLHELNHRVKNQLMVIQSIAMQTFSKATSIKEGLDSFSGRLHAFASAQDLLLAADWKQVRLLDLLQTAIIGSGNSLEQITIRGPELRVSPNHSVPISLAVHELCTNALKYGALSTPGGLVHISWTIDEVRQNVDFCWQELGGPPVVAPTRKGFGAKLLTSNLRSALAADVEIDYPRTGLVFRVRAPLSELNR